MSIHFIYEFYFDMFVLNFVYRFFFFWPIIIFFKPLSYFYDSFLVGIYLGIWSFTVLIILNFYLGWKIFDRLLRIFSLVCCIFESRRHFWPQCLFEILCRNPWWQCCPLLFYFYLCIILLFNLLFGDLIFYYHLGFIFYSYFLLRDKINEIICFIVSLVLNLVVIFHFFWLLILEECFFSLY